MKSKEKLNRGITLVALVITIIVLLILAGISIQALTNQGIFGKAQEAKKRTENAQKEEDKILKNYLGEINEVMGNNNKPATTMVEAQSDEMLTKKVNSPIQDTFGNKITIPAGFKIKVDDTTKNATTVDKGIVIVDSNENEFVWIPTGKIYTDVDRTEDNAKTIELNRYEFDGNGNPTAQNDEPIVWKDYNWQELATSTLGNTTAKNIADFKIKASGTGSGGFYIGRYEARKNSNGAITEKGTDSVWNNIIQPDAATQARNMYKNATTYTSDLINSYAWDTATLFLQTFGDNPTYSKQTPVNTTLAPTGTNDTANYNETQDVQCNVYDMASNTLEWETETYSNSGSPFAIRGGYYCDSSTYTSGRHYVTISSSTVYISFRALLYL